MTSRIRRIGAAGAVGLSALALSVAAPAASAAPSTEPGTRHCTLDAATGDQECFASLDEATGRAVQRTSGLAAKADGDVIQGTFFDGADYSGNSLTVWGPALCEKDGVVNWQLDLGDDWKNKITSVQPWGNCWIWLYPEPNLTGDRDGPFKENNPNVGSFMDNRTQSIGFS